MSFCYLYSSSNINNFDSIFRNHRLKMNSSVCVQKKTNTKTKEDTPFERFMKRLPPYIGKEILKFLIPDPRYIYFFNCNPASMRYSLNFEKAFRTSITYCSGICCETKICRFASKETVPVKNNKGEFLSRIKKKNGKHRYYLTTPIETYYCQGCGMEGCRSQYCRGTWETDTTYKSVYVGKDIENALYELMLLNNYPKPAAYRREPTNNKKVSNPLELDASDW
jgi:hypothetical protein